MDSLPPRRRDASEFRPIGAVRQTATHGALTCYAFAASFGRAPSRIGVFMRKAIFAIGVAVLATLAWAPDARA